MTQIDTAIEMFYRRNWGCAITLALAAETQIPNPETTFVTSKLRSVYGAEFIDRLNEPRNWLKHPSGPDTATLLEMDAFIAILRSISKFSSQYRAWSEPMAKFDAWFKERLSDN